MLITLNISQKVPMEEVRLPSGPTPATVAEATAVAVEDKLLTATDLQEALGRRGFVAGPLLFLKPLLGPVYAWLAAVPAGELAARGGVEAPA